MAGQMRQTAVDFQLHCIDIFSALYLFFTALCSREASIYFYARDSLSLEFKRHSLPGKRRFDGLAKETFTIILSPVFSFKKAEFKLLTSNKTLKWTGIFRFDVKKGIVKCQKKICSYFF